MADHKQVKKDKPIFISCSTNDIKIARYFRSAIFQLPGYWGYIARDQPETFEYPSEKIAEWLEKCYAYIILYTRSGLESPMVNQEFGFFYHRFRNVKRNKPLIFLVKSINILEQIDGFAYGREAIPLNPADPKHAIKDFLWEMKNAYSIDLLEIFCGEHVINIQWPSSSVCQEYMDRSSLLEYECDVCGDMIRIDPYTFLRVATR